MGQPMEIYEVVAKLVGSIQPIGDTNVDNERFANLTVLCELVDKLLTDIDDVAMNKDRAEYSMKRAGQAASKFFDRMGITE